MLYHVSEHDTTECKVGISILLSILDNTEFLLESKKERKKERKKEKEKEKERERERKQASKQARKRESWKERTSKSTVQLSSLLIEGEKKMVSTTAIP